jgi:general secretion pathway protein D
MNRINTTLAQLLRWYPSLRGPVIALTAAMLVTASAGAQQPPPTSNDQEITLNFKDAELQQIVEYMSMLTGKTFVVDPRVRAQVTVLSSRPVTADAAYQAFLSILAVHGFAAVPQGNVVKIVPDANVRQMPANDLPGSTSSTSDEIVTQVISVRNVSAAQLVPILRPLIPTYGHLAAYPSSNMLIISDRAANVNRMIRIIERIDQSGDDQIDIVRLENASASEIVRTMNTLNTGTQQAGGEAGGGATAKVVADDRTNSVLLTGEKTQRLRLKALIAHLDTPLENGGDTEVRYLHYADAEDIAKKLKEQGQSLSQAAGQPAAAAGGGSSQANKDLMVWADKQTNAIIITAPPKVKKQVMSIIDKLDIRRPQVLVEAIIVEVSSTKTSELGINWALYNNDSNNGSIPGAVFNQPTGTGDGIGDIAAAIQNPSAATIPTGLTFGLGRIAGAGTNFAVLLRALRGDANTNIISTPSILTIDNEEAEVKIAQEVPFLTGQYTNASTASSGTTGLVNPFQTIQREEVGTILKITPQINEGDSVLLKISQEQSGIAQGTSGAVDLITNKRTITTKALVEDGGIIVLGGLIEDNLREGENRVPILGSIPILGNLFKTRNVDKSKTNLMVFIRPTILRESAETAIQTNAKYNLMRDIQARRGNGKVTLLPGDRQPTLPPLEDLTKYADPTAGARAPSPDTDADKSQLQKGEKKKPEAGLPPADPTTSPPPN